MLGNCIQLVSDTNQLSKASTDAFLLHNKHTVACFRIVRWQNFGWFFEWPTHRLEEAQLALKKGYNEQAEFDAALISFVLDIC